MGKYSYIVGRELVKGWFLFDNVSMCFERENNREGW